LPECVVVDIPSWREGITGWSNAMVPKMGDNEGTPRMRTWASSRFSITGTLHITAQLIFTFRARERTKQSKANGKAVIKIG